MVGFGGRYPTVAGHDGLVGEAPAIEFEHRLDAGPHGGRSAVVDTSSDEVVEDGQEFPGKADGDLLGGYRDRIPNWYSIRDATPRLR